MNFREIKDTELDPLNIFEDWYATIQASNLKNPTAMTLATVTPEGQPSARIVLLKGFDPDGFVFYTNYLSQKAKDLENNNKATLLFFWDDGDRQVRIEGVTEKTSGEESDDYFESRPYESKIGALASTQSQPIESREVFLERYAGFEREFPSEVPRPQHWGGYRLKAQSIEFWVRGDYRLHDRHLFELKGTNWVQTRLSP